MIVLCAIDSLLIGDKSHSAVFHAIDFGSIAQNPLLHQILMYKVQ